MLRKQSSIFPNETEGNSTDNTNCKICDTFPLWSWIRNDQFLMNGILYKMQLTVSDKLDTI